MTTGIPHGPLSGADLPKLTGLSVLLVVLPPHIGLAGRNQPPLGAVIRAQPQSPFVQSVFLPDYEPDFGWHVSRFTYLGERPEPGSPVILAPEGGWSKNPVPGRMVRVELRSGVNASGPSDDFDWSHETRRGKPLSQSLDIVAFSLIEAAKPEVKGEPSVSAAVEGDTASGLSSDRPAQALSDLAGMDGGWGVGDRAFALGALRAAKATLNGLGATHGARIGMVEEAIRRLSATPASPPAETGEGWSIAMDALARLAAGTERTFNAGTAQQMAASTTAIASDAMNRIASLPRPAPSDTERMRAAFDRQTENMAFILNHATLPEQWYEKFSRELEEDRAALAEKEAGQ